MSFVRHAIAYVTLGLLCGWYYFLLLLTIVLIALLSLSNQSYVRAPSLIVVLTIMVITIIPIKFPQRCDWFINHWIFDIWHEYFDFTSDCTKFTAHFKQHPSARYMFAEFPHGIFPMGQFLSASMIKTITPGQMIHGTGADIVFKIPIMRHIMGMTLDESIVAMMTLLLSSSYCIHCDSVGRYSASEAPEHIIGAGQAGLPPSNHPRRHRRDVPHEQRLGGHLSADETQHRQARYTGRDPHRTRWVSSHRSYVTYSI